MTLEQILQLVRLCREDPSACGVLHDALLTRYGSGYERYVRFTISEARRWRSGRRREDRRQAFVLVVDPARLSRYEARPEDEPMLHEQIASLEATPRFSPTLTRRVDALDAIPFRVVSDRVGWRNELDHLWGADWRGAVPVFRAAPPRVR